jgi:hypothetical protein
MAVRHEHGALPSGYLAKGALRFAAQAQKLPMKDTRAPTPSSRSILGAASVSGAEQAVIATWLR